MIADLWPSEIFRSFWDYKQQAVKPWRGLTQYSLFNMTRISALWCSLLLLASGWGKRTGLEVKGGWDLKLRWSPCRRRCKTCWSLVVDLQGSRKRERRLPTGTEGKCRSAVCTSYKTWLGKSLTLTRESGSAVLQEWKRLWLFCPEILKVASFIQPVLLPQEWLDLQTMRCGS